MCVKQHGGIFFTSPFRCIEAELVTNLTVLLEAWAEGENFDMFSNQHGLKKEGSGVRVRLVEFV